MGLTGCKDRPFGPLTLGRSAYTVRV
jgi:hypothetical protein